MTGVMLKRVGLLLGSLVVLLGLLAPASAGQAETQPGKRPNIIFIFSDDHAVQSIGAYGHPLTEFAPTPNLDRLAKEGAIFRNSFCTNSICAPSRAVVLTGKFSHVNGKLDNAVARPFDGSQPTLPKYLQEAGYLTALIGKWHLISDPTGFDHWEILPGQGQYYNPDFVTPQGQHREQGYVGDLITDKALAWMKQRTSGNAQTPFFLMVGPKAPHRNWMPGPNELAMLRDVELPEPQTLFDDYSGRSSAAKQQEMEIARHMDWVNDLKLTPPLVGYEQAGHEEKLSRYYARMNAEQRAAWDAAYAEENAEFEARRAEMSEEEIVRWKYQRYVKDYLRTAASVDRCVGRILDYLDETGQDQNTIVVYSSDQGFFLGEHGWYDKRWMFEESLRMPLLMRWPARIEPGTEVKELVQNIDHAPTLLAAAGLEVPQEMQGRSMLPLLEGQPVEWRDAIYYHYYEYPAWHMVRKHYGVRTDRYKLIRYYGIDEWELFDLEQDPHELKSVYGDPAYADVQAELMQKLKALREKYRDTTGEAL